VRPVSLNILEGKGGIACKLLYEMWSEKLIVPALLTVQLHAATFICLAAILECDRRIDIHMSPIVKIVMY